MSWNWIIQARSECVTVGSSSTVLWRDAFLPFSKIIHTGFGTNLSLQIWAAKIWTTTTIPFTPVYSCRHLQNHRLLYIIIIILNQLYSCIKSCFFDVCFTLTLSPFIILKIPPLPSAFLPFVLPAQQFPLSFRSRSRRRRQAEVNNCWAVNHRLVSSRRGPA